MLVLLSFNVGGVIPYRYAVRIHFVVRLSFAIPFWFITFMLNFNPNWRLFWLVRIREGGFLLPTAIAIISEWVRILVRPITLACRLRINIFVGQVLIKLASIIAVGMLFPFGWESFSVLGSIFWQGVTMFLFCVELGVRLMQTLIFVGLVVYYVYEVVIGPETMRD